jgi:hypothetical protein
MNLIELKSKVEIIISDIKNNGIYPKENNLIDYKLKLNITSSKSNIEIFLMNFAKDIISFSNADGGIILIGINEDSSGEYTDIGLDEPNVELLTKIDLNHITQQFVKITNVGVSLDLQMFQIAARRLFYIIIEKNNNILVPKDNFPEYKILNGAIYYRASSKNEHANISTANFNRFIQMKANEKSKEFMEIWSKLLPEMVDINPREVLILNPMQNKVYGFNSKDNVLSGSDIEIDKTHNGIFNIILNAITAGEIGKITTNEGKPLYKIVGEFQNNRDHIILSNLVKAVQNKAIYKITTAQVKILIAYLKWANSSEFKVDNPEEDSINQDFKNYIWIETTDSFSKKSKVYFSSEAIQELIKSINNRDLHQHIFAKELIIKENLKKLKNENLHIA